MTQQHIGDLHHGVVGRFERASFDSFEVKSAEQHHALGACVAMASSLADCAGAGLWLLGPPGTGKSHLASAMVLHVLSEQGGRAAIHSERTIIRMLRSRWGSEVSAPSEGELIAQFGALDLLVIDDVGVGFGTDSEALQLFDVIDLRYRLERPTVLVSNLTATEIKAALGERSFDRLRQGARTVAMNWPSHRGSRS